MTTVGHNLKTDEILKRRCVTSGTDCTLKELAEDPYFLNARLSETRSNKTITFFKITGIVSIEDTCILKSPHTKEDVEQLENNMLKKMREESKKFGRVKELPYSSSIYNLYNIVHPSGSPKENDDKKLRVNIGFTSDLTNEGMLVAMVKELNRNELRDLMITTNYDYDVKTFHVFRDQNPIDIATGKNSSASRVL